MHRLALLGIVLSALLTGCNQPDPESKRANQPAMNTEPTTPSSAPPASPPAELPKATPPSPIPKEVPKLDWIAFYKTRVENEAAAQEQYGNKRFRISGTVHKIEDDGVVTISLDTKSDAPSDALLFMSIKNAAVVKRGKATFEAEFVSYRTNRFPAFHFDKAKFISQP